MNTKSIRLSLGALLTTFFLALHPAADAGQIKINHWRDATAEGTLLVLGEVKNGKDVAALMVGGGLLALAGQDMYAVKISITNLGDFERVVSSDSIRIALGGQSFAMTSFAVKGNGGAKFGSKLILQPGQSFEGYAFYACPEDFGNSVRRGNGRLGLR